MLNHESDADTRIPSPFVTLTGDRCAGRSSGKRGTVIVALGWHGLSELSEGVDGDGGGGGLGVIVWLL